MIVIKTFIFETMTAGVYEIQAEDFQKACTKASYVFDEKKHIKPDPNYKLKNPYEIIK